MKVSFKALSVRLKANLVPIFILLIFGGFTAFLYHNWAHGPDESYFMFMADKILHGSIPYADYTDNKPPGIWYFLAINMSLFGKSIYSARIFVIIMNIISAFLLFVLGTRLWNRKVGLVSGLIFLIGMMNPYFDVPYVMTEQFVVFFGLLGFIFLIRPEPQSRHLIFCGAALGLAILFKQSALLLFIAICMFYLTRFWIPTFRSEQCLKSSIKQLSLICMGIMFPVFCVIGYFFFKDGLGDLVNDSILSLGSYGYSFDNDLLYDEFMSFFIIWVMVGLCLLNVGYRFIVRKVDWNTFLAIWFLVSCFPLISRQYGHYFIQILPPASLLASIAIVNLFYKLRSHVLNNKKRLPWLIPTILSAVIFFIATVLAYHGHYYLLILPFVSLFALLIIVNIFNKVLKHSLVTERLIQLSAFTGLGIAIILIANTVVYMGLRYETIKQASDRQIYYQEAVSDYVSSHILEGESLLAYPYIPWVYVLSDREPVTKTLILDNRVLTSNMACEATTQILNSNFSYAIVYSSGNGSISNKLPSVQKFLVDNFDREYNIGPYYILRKISE